MGGPQTEGESCSLEGRFLFDPPRITAYAKPCIRYKTSIVPRLFESLPNDQRSEHRKREKRAIAFESNRQKGLLRNRSRNVGRALGKRTPHTLETGSLLFPANLKTRKRNFFARTLENPWRDSSRAARTKGIRAVNSRCTMLHSLLLLIKHAPFLRLQKE